MYHYFFGIDYRMVHSLSRYYCLEYRRTLKLQNRRRLFDRVLDKNSEIHTLEFAIASLNP
jgi:hypothetical protein